MTQRSDVIEQIAAAVDLVRPGHPARVAIDGVDAAGKTILADELALALSRLGRAVIRASIDGFHNPSEVRHRRGPRSADGYFFDSFDYSALRDVVLDPLGPGGSRRFRRAVFDFRTDASVQAPLEEAPLHSILLFDGVFLLRPEIRDCWDFSIFVHADFSHTLSRAMARDVELFGSEEEVMRRYTDRYIPGQKIYLAAAAPQAVADLVVINNDPASPFIHRRSSN